MTPPWPSSVVVLVVVVSGSGCARHIEPVRVAPSVTEAELARGKYLAEAVMGCGACHAQRDWGAYAGPPREGTEFGGSRDLARDERFPESFSFSAPNLTPHHLAQWSNGEVARAIVFGQTRDGRGLFPYMPYFEYRDALARDDLSALVAYLRTLPTSPWEPPGPRRFPMPGFVLNGLPEERELRELAPRAGSAEYGRYLTEIAGCAGCHTQADKRGNPVGAKYAGGREFYVPRPGGGTVRSANLTPDGETGLGGWSRAQFIARFRQTSVEGARAQVIAPRAFNSVMPWWAYARMTDDDVGAVFDFLRTLAPARSVVVRHTPEGAAAP